MDKKIRKKIFKINWEWEWGRNSSTLINYAIFQVWTNSPKEFAGHFNNFIIFIKDSYTNFFVGKNDLDRCGEHAYNISIKKGFIEFYERGAQNACQELIELSRLDSKKDIIKQYHDWVNAYIQLLYFVVQIRIFNRIGEQKLKEFIKLKIKDQAEQIEIFSHLSATTRKNAFSDFHKLMQRAYHKKLDGNKKEFGRIVDKIVEEFRWMPVGYGDEPAWNKNDIEKELQNFKSIKEHKINKKAMIKKLKPNKEILRLIEVIDLFVYYKDYLRRVCNYCHYYSRPLFKKLAKKFNLSFKEIKMLFPDELGKVMPKKSRTLFYHKGILYRFNYDKVLENKLFSYNSKEIKGTVASTGKVKGKIVVIKDYNDLDKKYDNCILVSVMTSPDITPAIKKAKAIVTDEGGITCHAAIISRELNIPCIIGTKIATKVLCDGDLVEVDANRGIVKILKFNKSNK